MVLTAEESIIVERARRALMAPCLDAAGLSLDRVGLGGDPPPAARSRHPSFTEDEVDLEAVRAYGYVALEPAQLDALLAGSNGAGASTPPPAAVLSEAELEVADSCARSATAKLSVEQWAGHLAQAGAADLDILKATIASSDYMSALDVWRSCVRDGGYVFADPSAATVAVTPTSGWSLPIDDAVRRQATIDVTCRRGARLRATLDRLVDEGRRRWLEEHPEFLVDVDRSRRHLLDLAASHASGDGH